jgi:UDP-glucuronate 4-epimerase
MTILLTGATGFVMANLGRHLAEHGHDVLAADLVSPDAALQDYLGRLPGRVTFRAVDVTDGDALRALIRESRPERLVHGAAITSIPPEMERRRFVRTAEVNVTGTLAALEAWADGGGGRVVVVSSGSIYGARPDLRPISEDDAARPERLYPITKWAAEALACRFAELSGLDLGVTRLASPFGPFERDNGSRPLLSPIQGWVTAALAGQVVTIPGVAGAPRDVAYAPDVASGIAAVLLAERLPHRVYNVGWGRAASGDDVVSALRQLVPGVRVEARPDEPSPWSASALRGPLSIERLRRDLGWAPRHDLASGLAAYVEWLRRRRSL